jgi:hypothetical protein
VGTCHRTNCRIHKPKVLVESVLCRQRARHLRFVQRGNRRLQYESSPQPFGAWEIGKVTDFGQNVGHGIQGLEPCKNSNQQIVIGLRVLASALKRLDTVAVDRSDSEEHKEIRVDQQPGTGA